MTQPIPVSIIAADTDAIATFEGTLVVFATEEGGLDQLGRRVNRLSKGALKRAADAPAFEDLAIGKHIAIAFPAGLLADKVLLVKLPRRTAATQVRTSGAGAAGACGTGAVTILAGAHPKAAEFVMGLSLRAYAFDAHKTTKSEGPTQITIACNAPDDVANVFAPLQAQIEGVYFTRDLTNEPANVLTTTEFATRLEALRDLGIKVTVLEEPELEKLDMNALLAVGFGSETPSKVVTMEWFGGGDEAPLALVGKGVVFDTGGISIKPAGGMEDMTMDMGGAGVVSGVMHTIATRKAPANVVGLVGLVENMPDGRAQRPGDVVTTMKGDTVEVINTDAEGRLVLCDVLWHTQQAFKPAAIIDLATLTGAAIIALGHENAAVYANDDAFAKKFLKAAQTEDEGAWHMPLGKAYAKQLESRVADLKNVGGRPAGSITAAEFLHRFIEDDMPWIHLDIAGVAFRSGPTTFAPKGATGWGVRTIDRLIATHFES